MAGPGIEPGTLAYALPVLLPTELPSRLCGEVRNRTPTVPRDPTTQRGDRSNRIPSLSVTS